MLLVQDVTTTFHCFIYLLHYQTPSKVIQQNYRKCSMTTDCSEKNPPAFSPWAIYTNERCQKAKWIWKDLPTMHMLQGLQNKEVPLRGIPVPLKLLSAITACGRKWEDSRGRSTESAEVSFPKSVVRR